MGRPAIRPVDFAKQDLVIEIGQPVGSGCNTDLDLIAKYAALNHIPGCYADEDLDPVVSLMKRQDRGIDPFIDGSMQPSWRFIKLTTGSRSSSA